jgi:hypothetical protein
MTRTRHDPRRYDPAGYTRALTAQQTARLAAATPVPARITAALDLCQLDGPDVDTACGAREPDVDLWETGELIPTFTQVQLLAALTGFPVAFFYQPYTAEDLGGVWLCGRHCEYIPPRPDVAVPVGTRQGALW